MSRNSCTPRIDRLKFWHQSFTSRFLSPHSIISKTKHSMMIYDKWTTKSISQFKKWWDSSFGTLEMAVLEFEVSCSNCPKQIEIKVEEDECNACFSSKLLQLQEFSNHHCWPYFEQWRFRSFWQWLYQNRWRSRSMEHEAKRITQIGEELMKFRSKMLNEDSRDFGENGGKSSYSSWKLQLWLAFCYNYD